MATTYRGRRFDRVYEPDARNYPVAPRLAEVNPVKRAFRQIVGHTWAQKLRLDQGNDGACVGFGWSHELSAAPHEWPYIDYDSAMTLYHEAQEFDEFPDTPPEEGSSVLGGAKACVADETVSVYRWATTVEETALAVATLTPVVIGVNWYEGMMDTDRCGFVRPTGSVVGGHCVCIRGVAPRRKYFRITNSWGPGWGENGECKISFRDFAKLLEEDGEVCVPTET